MDDEQPVAGGGLLHRRALLGAGAVLAAGTGAARSATPPGFEPWMLAPGGGFSDYGVPSRWEEDVKRGVAPSAAFPTIGASRTPLQRLEGIVTPSGLHFERHHNGVPDIDPGRHRLVVHGLVRRPLSFSLEALARYPMQSRIRFIECGGNSGANAAPEAPQRDAGSIHGMISCSEWTGVPLSVLLDEAGVLPEASWVVAEGADAGAMNRSVPLEKCMDDAVVALFQNGEAIRPEQGYPMRLLLPGFEGNANVKWLHRLTVTAGPGHTRQETSRYTDLLKTGIARQFVLRVRAKSVILKPSFGYEMRGPGLYEISGLAWSDAPLERVEVSADGGRSWAEAAFDGPPLPKALARFRIPWRWDGAPAVLMSRAVEVGGYVQPSRAAILAERQPPGMTYHFNGIQAWAIDAAGKVSNVHA